MTTPRGEGKPKKPRGFPLTPHDNGSWCKKIRGRLHYFGPWSDPEGARAKYLDQKDDLHAGREPRSAKGLPTVGKLCNLFRSHKEDSHAAGEIVRLTLDSYGRTCDKVVETFGPTTLLADLRPADFERLRAVLAKTNGPRALSVYVQHVRSLFKYADESGLLDRPMRFGPGFKRPSAATIRKLRASKPPRLFTAAELRQVIGAASVPIRAMVLLGINCGFGNADCDGLPLSAIDLAGGWVNYPRPKTGIHRRCKLWPETVKALKAVLASRPEPADPANAGLVFITHRGARYNGGTKHSAIGEVFRGLLRRLNLKREGLSFYALRRNFETVAGGCKDQIAVDAVMGHLTPGMGTSYREKIEDSRLEAVADHVHKWLFV